MTQTSEQPRSSEPSAIVKVLKVLVRLVIVVLFGLLIGAGLYYGVPWVYRNVIQPVQNNTAEIQSLKTEMDRIETELQEQTSAQGDRARTLEGELGTLQGTTEAQAQALSTAEARLSILEPDMEILAQTLDDQDGAISELSDQQAAILDRLADQEEALAQQESALDTLETETNDQLTEVTDQLTDLDVAYQEVLSTTQPLVQRLAWLQIAQDLLRVRLLLLENNPGVAVDTIDIAIEHLNSAVALEPEMAVAATDLRDRMATLSTLIEERSFRVTPTLEALWVDVIGQVLPEAAEFLTPTPTQTPGATPFPTRTPFTTPTPSPTPAPES